MTKPPVLALPNFSEPFVIETDASNHGIGVVLMQQGHPIAFISKALSPRHVTLSTYEKELLAVIHAVQKWRSYLLDRHFVIKTDQQSLKHLLENKLNTSFQQRWLSKLLGYDYEICYKRGAENKVADSLSRATHGELLQMAVSDIHSDLYRSIQKAWEQDTNLKAIISAIQRDGSIHPKYSWANQELRRKGKLVIGNFKDIKHKIMSWMHDSSQWGHSGVTATLKRLKTLFFWPKMTQEVAAYIKNCVVCQKCKADTAAQPGLLQPLPISEGVWEDIAMDFIEGLPNSHGKDVIMVVIDRLSKYAYFFSLSHHFFAIDIARYFWITSISCTFFQNP